jgi:hypothetical protein
VKFWRSPGRLEGGRTPNPPRVGRIGLPSAMWAGQKSLGKGVAIGAHVGGTQGPEGPQRGSP